MAETHNQNTTDTGDIVQGSKYVNFNFYFGKISDPKWLAAVCVLLAISGTAFYFKTPILHYFTLDKAFAVKDDHYKILILPFNQLCSSDNKMQDAGKVLHDRLVKLNISDTLNMTVAYLENETKMPENAAAFRNYHRANLILYGDQESGCSDSTRVCYCYDADSTSVEKQRLQSESSMIAGNPYEFLNGKGQEDIDYILYLTAGKAAMEKFDYGKAVRFFEKARSKVETYEVVEKILRSNYYAGNYENVVTIAKKEIDKEYVKPKIYTLNYGNYTNYIAVSYLCLNDFNNALIYNLKGIEVLEKKADKNNPNLAACYINTAATYRGLNKNDIAIEYDLKALKINEVILDEDSRILATNYDNIAVSYTNLGQSKMALKYNATAKHIFEKNIDKNALDLAACYYNRAMIFFQLKDYNALLYINKSIKIYRKNYPNGHPDLDKSLKGLEDINKSIASEKQ